MQNEFEYWNSFYETWPDSPPSQFAALVAAEYAHPGSQLYDLGCGNGRDSKFFYDYGIQVAASDASAQAISRLRGRYPNNPSISFDVVDFSNQQELKTHIEAHKLSGRPALYYARFVLHTLDDPTLHSFISVIKESVVGGDSIALEFRTRKDDRLSGKVTPTHFRRGLDLGDVLRYFSEDRFEVLYSVEGFGLAVHGSDDAHVARLVIRVVGRPA